VLDFLREYGLFVLELVTVLGLFAVVVLVVLRAARRGGDMPSHGHLKVSHLGDKFRRLRLTIQQQTLTPKQWKVLVKQEDAADKARDKQPSNKPRIFVVDFVGDVRASAVESLRQEVSAIVQAVQPGDEVMVRLESPGGMVHSYGLAASQLARFREAKIPLTICVDKVAASGGYMMACVADTIVAAPFAVLGSIGVVAQLPNLNRLLKKMDVDYEIVTAGKWKRTLTVLGENTDEGRAQFKREIDNTHQLFKDFIANNRPTLDLDAVADGRTWYGTQARDIQLCDVVATSDDWLLQRVDKAELIAVSWQFRRGMGERLGALASVTLGRVADTVAHHEMQRSAGL
jgi:serine protease SohB